MRRIELVLAVCLAVIAVGALFWVTRSRSTTLSAPPETVASVVPPSDEPAADWCAPGYSPMAGGCLALPTPERPASSLVLYLHGRYAQDASTEEVDRQKRLASRATAAGFAVLALRGRLGECTSSELATWFCWPSNDQNLSHGASFVAGWAGALDEATRRARSSRRFVLGFSNGGYFAGLLAMQGLLPADAFVVAHGGPVAAVEASAKARPMLLLSADEDIAQDDMIRLDADLTRAGWAHDSYARDGGHGLTEEDIDSALTFFARYSEKLPLDPPLPLHRPVHHAHPVASVERDE